jgi:phage tail sheath protein FI
VDSFKKGPLTPQYITSDKQFIDTYGTPDPAVSLSYYSALSALRAGAALWVLRVVNAATYPLSLYSDAGTSFTNETAAANPLTFTFGATGRFVVYPSGPGVEGHKLSLSITGAPVASNDFTLNVFDTSQSSVVPVESWPVSLVYKVNGNGRQMYAEDVINNQSSRIRISVNTAIVEASRLVVNTTGASAFSGSSSGSTITDSDLVSGWNVFLDTSKYDVSMLINGGRSTTAVHNAMAALALNRADCVALLDIPTASEAVAAALTYRTTTLNINNNYSALYAPSYKRYDEFTDRNIAVPMSGGAAATLAYTDANREPWFSNAGLNRGVVRDAIDLSVRYSQIGLSSECAQLAGAQINYAASIPGSGIAIMEEYTATPAASALQSLHVRRLLIVLEKSMASALRYSLHEQHTAQLRTRVKLMLESFLEDVANRGGLQGGRDVGFRVQCDEVLNTPQVIDANELRVNVFLKPTRAVYFIRLNSVLTRSGASFEELIQAGTF